MVPCLSIVRIVLALLLVGCTGLAAVVDIGLAAKVEVVKGHEVPAAEVEEADDAVAHDGRHGSVEHWAEVALEAEAALADHPPGSPPTPPPEA